MRRNGGVRIQVCALAGTHVQNVVRTVDEVAVSAIIIVVLLFEPLIGLVIEFVAVLKIGAVIVFRVVLLLLRLEHFLLLNGLQMVLVRAGDVHLVQNVAGGGVLR